MDPDTRGVVLVFGLGVGLERVPLLEHHDVVVLGAAGQSASSPVLIS
jgi:hypothetical protein